MALPLPYLRLRRVLMSGAHGMTANSHLRRFAGIDVLMTTSGSSWRTQVHAADDVTWSKWAGHQALELWQLVALHGNHPSSRACYDVVACAPTCNVGGESIARPELDGPSKALVGFAPITIGLAKSTGILDGGTNAESRRSTPPI